MEQIFEGWNRLMLMRVYFRIYKAISINLFEIFNINLWLAIFKFKKLIVHEEFLF